MAKQTSPERPYRLYLKEWIAYKHLNQDKMAELMNCSPGTVSKLIAGEMNQTLNWLARFAHALGPDVEVADLLRDPKSPQSEDLLSKVPSERRDQVISIIHTFLQTKP